MRRETRLVGLVALTIAFAIWLFPHWLVHAPSLRGTEAWDEDDPGYAFLFTPPPMPNGYTGPGGWHMEVDWTLQFYEWGTLVFLSAFSAALLRKKT